MLPSSLGICHVVWGGGISILFGDMSNGKGGGISILFGYMSYGKGGGIGIFFSHCPMDWGVCISIIFGQMVLCDMSDGMGGWYSHFLGSYLRWLNVMVSGDGISVFFGSM